MTWADTPLDQPRREPAIEGMSEPTRWVRFNRELGRPIMRRLHVALWTMVAIVAASLVYFHFTDPAPANPPARSAEASAPTNTPDSRAEAASGKDTH